MIRLPQWRQYLSRAVTPEPQLLQGTSLGSGAGGGRLAVWPCPDSGVENEPEDADGEGVGTVMAHSMNAGSGAQAERSQDHGFQISP